MINYIQTNNLLSSTADEIKAIADADLRTVSDVVAGDLQTLLADEGLLLYLGNAWTGSLLAAITEGPLLMGLIRLQAHLLQPDREKVVTTKQQHAAAFWGIVQVARGLVSDEAALRAKLNAMCGGRAAPSATVEEWQAALDAIALDALKATKRSAAATRYNAYVDAIAAWDGAAGEPEL